MSRYFIISWHECVKRPWDTKLALPILNLDFFCNKMVTCSSVLVLMMFLTICSLCTYSVCTNHLGFLQIISFFMH